MQKRTYTIAITTAAMIATGVSAASYSTAQLNNDGSNLFNGGTQVIGQDFGGQDSNVSVNGVSFELNTGAVSHTAPAGNDIGARNTPGALYFIGGDFGLQEVMDDIVFGSSVDLTFTGLNVGTAYIAQFFSWDADVEAEGAPFVADKEFRHTVITSTIDGVTHIQEQGVTGDGSTSDQLLPVFTRVEFVANASSVTFSFNLDPTRTFDDNIILNGATLHEVPEPGSLALLGLGGLAMLRRRRA